MFINSFDDQGSKRIATYNNHHQENCHLGQSPYRPTANQYNLQLE